MRFCQNAKDTRNESEAIKLNILLWRERTIYYLYSSKKLVDQHNVRFLNEIKLSLFTSNPYQYKKNKSQIYNIDNTRNCVNGKQLITCIVESNFLNEIKLSLFTSNPYLAKIFLKNIK